MTKNEADALELATRLLQEKDAEVKRLSAQITELNARLTFGQTNDALLAEVTEKHAALQRHVRSQRDNTATLQRQLDIAEDERTKWKKRVTVLERENAELRGRLGEYENPPGICAAFADGLRRVADWMEGDHEDE